MSDSPFTRLTEIIAMLRHPEKGCPWDREQTHQSLKPYLIEESYEVLDAIDAGGGKLCEELGDVLLQIVLHSQLAAERGAFTADDVVRGLTEKLIVRHPHVFGDVDAKTSAEVLRNWELIKQQERAKQEEQGEKSILDGVPSGLPALQRAQRVGERAARVGFEWRTVEDVRDKVLEELREFMECVLDQNTPRARAEEEFGDLLFALTQLSRRLKFNSEELLRQATKKFERRFREVERRAGKPLNEMTLEQMDGIWEQIKTEERKSG